MEFYRAVSEAYEFLSASYCLEAQKHCLLASSLHLCASGSCLRLGETEGLHAQSQYWPEPVQSVDFVSHHWPNVLGSSDLSMTARPFLAS